MDVYTILINTIVCRGGSIYSSKMVVKGATKIDFVGSCQNSDFLQQFLGCLSVNMQPSVKQLNMVYFLHTLTSQG